MKHYTTYSLSVRKQARFITFYALKEGVFKTPQGKFIARVRKGKSGYYTTISQHDTIEEANSAYSAFYNSDSEAYKP